jgi:hypothetical protein
VRTAALETLSPKLAPLVGLALRARLHDPVPDNRELARRWLRELEDSGALPELTRFYARPGIPAAERLDLARTIVSLCHRPEVPMLWRLADEEADPACLLALCEGTLKFDRDAGRHMIQSASKKGGLTKATKDALTALTAASSPLP